MRLRNKLVYLALVLFLFSGLLYGDMISYGVHQGIGQFNILYHAVPISDILDDPNYPEQKKEKLRLIQEIREFAIDSLGLNDSQSYTKLYDQEGKPVLWVLTAAKPFELEQYEWFFPFLGSLGYKGFFDLTKAEQEEEELEKQNFDTDLGAVNAWSTLGFFNDPVLSNMLERSSGSLARLIIHELTHGTLYAEGEDSFNENLATFVGDNGAIIFMKHRYGAGSTEVKQYLETLDDIEKYSEHMIRSTQRLDSLYSSFKEMSYTFEEKVDFKEAMILEVLRNSDTISFSEKKRYGHLLRDDFRPNNTYFMTFRRYREKQNEFQEEFESKFNNDFPKYFDYLREKYGG